jgi:hypothetical protein
VYHAGRPAISIVQRFHSDAEFDNASPQRLDQPSIIGRDLEANDGFPIGRSQKDAWKFAADSIRSIGYQMHQNLIWPRTRS